MKTRILYSLLFSCILYCSSCKSQKNVLSRDDLKWIDVYNSGDTLIFKSSENQFDTSYIIKKEVFYPEASQPGAENQQWGVVWYKNKNLSYHPDGTRLITIHKREPGKDAFISIMYLYSSVIIANPKGESLLRTEKDNVYEIDCSHPNAKENQPIKIYWHKSYGIVKYITQKGVIWEKVN